MNHLTDLQFSMYADGALEGNEREDALKHISECADCRSHLQAFQGEQQAITRNLAIPDDIRVPESTPKFTRPLSLRNFALANVATGVTIWLAQFLWKTVFGELVIAGMTQLTSMYLPDAYELATDAALYFLKEGTTMIETYLGFVITTLVMLIAALAAVRVRRNRLLVCFSTVLFAGSAAMVSPDASALELRRSEGIVAVPADEVINDTLMIGAETITVDGTVNGDLLVAGRRIVVTGNVEGNLVAFGDSVSIRGNVGGVVVTAASNIELDDARVAGDLWAGGDLVTVGKSASVLGNATIASGLAAIEGSVARDVFAFAEKVDVSGSVGNDLEVFTEQVNLLGNGRVEGNVRIRSENEERLQQSDDSFVGGTIEFVGMPEEWEPSNRYASANYYLWQAVRLAAAFLAGLALLWLIPSLRDLRLEGGVDGLKTAGIGLIALVMLPVSMLLFAVTIVGLPFTLVLLCTWALLLYFAKIVVASMIGQLAMNPADPDQFILPLLVGLIIVIISINLPAIGGAVGFILTIIGMGMLTREIYYRVQEATS